MVVKDESSVLVTIKSMQGDTWLNNHKVDKDNTTVECEVGFMSVLLENLDDNRQLCRFLFTIDPKMEVIPIWLINQMIKIMSVVFMKKVEQRAASNANAKEIEEKKEFYD